MRHFGLLKGAAGGKCLIACTAKTAHAVRNIAQRHKFSLSIPRCCGVIRPCFCRAGDAHILHNARLPRVFVITQGGETMTRQQRRKQQRKRNKHVRHSGKVGKHLLDARGSENLADYRPSSTDPATLVFAMRFDGGETRDATIHAFREFAETLVDDSIVQWVVFLRATDTTPLPAPMPELMKVCTRLCQARAPKQADFVPTDARRCVFTPTAAHLKLSRSMNGISSGSLKIRTPTPPHPRGLSAYMHREPLKE